MVKIYPLWSCHAKIMQETTINSMHFLSQHWFLNWKRFVDLLVKVLTFGQIVDFFFIKILTCWLMQEWERLGFKIGIKMHEGQNWK
jgi:hypothetical protein